MTGEGEPYRPVLLIWVELPEGFVVGQELVAPDESTVDLGRVLLEAMAMPLVGPARQPERIRVAESDLARDVRTAIGEAIPVEVAPTPELNEVLQSLHEWTFGSDEEPSYLEDGRVPAEVLGELFSAAQLLCTVAPWEYVTDSQLLRLDIPDLAVEGGCVSLVGAVGKAVGFVIFPSREKYHTLRRAAEQHTPGRSRFDFGTDCLSLSFESAADLPPAMRREAATHGWPVENEHSYPRVRRWDRDGTRMPLVERDVRIASACAFSLAGFCLKHRDVFATNAFEPFCESYTTGEGPTVRITLPYDAAGLFDVGDGPPSATDPSRSRPRSGKVGRNQPCPCGSGKKYKKCHLQADEERQSADSRRATLRDLAAKVEEELWRFAMAHFGYEWQGFAEEFATDEETLDLALAWSLYHDRVRGRAILDWFLEEKGRLPPAELRWITAQRKAWLSVWEVTDVKPGETLTLADLLSHEVRCVREVEASKMLVARDVILSRVVDCDGVSVLSGTHSRALPPIDAAEVVRRARSRLRRKRAVPVERLRDEAFGRYLIRRWKEAVKAARARAGTPPVLQNTDGEPLLLTTDHFAVSPGGQGLVEARLAAIPDVHPPEPGDEWPVYRFVRSRDDAVLGEARFANGFLIAMTNSIERADALRARLERTCGRLLHHRVREHADPLSKAAPPLDHPSDESLDLPEAHEVLRVIKERHYGGWLDEPLPALGGKTPRAAAQTRAGKREVDTLLKHMENLEQQSLPSTRFDFSRFRRELKLEP